MISFIMVERKRNSLECIFLWKISSLFLQVYMLVWKSHYTYVWYACIYVYFSLCITMLSVVTCTYISLYILLYLKRLTRYILKVSLWHAAAGLRSRSVENKGQIVQEIRTHVWPAIESGKVKPVIYKSFPLAEAADAHRLLESSRHIGKILLTAWYVRDKLNSEINFRCVHEIDF